MAELTEAELAEIESEAEWGRQRGLLPYRVRNTLEVVPRLVAEVRLLRAAVRELAADVEQRPGAYLHCRSDVGRVIALIQEEAGNG
jgi:hypothetical protein